MMMIVCWLLWISKMSHLYSFQFKTIYNRNLLCFIIRIRALSIRLFLACKFDCKIEFEGVYISIFMHMLQNTIHVYARDNWNLCELFLFQPKKIWCRCCGDSNNSMRKGKRVQHEIHVLSVFQECNCSVADGHALKRENPLLCIGTKGKVQAFP